jgi:hypothetical protein
MDARTAITPATLATFPAGTPVTVVGSPDGYAVVVGEAAQARWLHSTSGQFRLFDTLDRAAAVLRQAGVRRWGVDVHGGVPG